MTRFRLGRVGRVAVGSCAIALVGAAALAGTVSASGPGRHVMAGTKPTWTAAAAAATAVAPAQAGLNARVWLAPRNAAGLDALAKAVSDPSSSQYGQFISEAGYRAQFAPTADQVGAVEAWLTSAGLSVTSVGPDSHYVAVTGSAAAMNTAFGTQLTSFVVSGKPELAPATDLSVPDSVSGLVQAVSGLSTFGHRMTPGDQGAPDAFVVGQPCSAFYGQKRATTLPRYHGQSLPYNVCGYTATQLRGAYGVTATRRSGAGATVAIVDAYDASTLEKDADTLSRLHGDQPFQHGQFKDLSVPEDLSTAADCGGNGWYGEQALDVEAVHGMAQAANVLYYGASSCYDDDLQASLARIVADNKASIVSNSYGEPTFEVIDGVLYITIDQTSWTPTRRSSSRAPCRASASTSRRATTATTSRRGLHHPDFPSGDPWVTAVGGTSIAIDRNNTRVCETGWGTSLLRLAANGKSWVAPGAFHGGAGGGYSQVFPRRGTRTSSCRRTPPAGPCPDVGMDADPRPACSSARRSRSRDGRVHYGEYRIGGTSLGSPLFAGAQAVASGNRRLGFANPFIYALAAFPGSTRSTTRRRRATRRTCAPTSSTASTATTARPSRCAFDQDSSRVTTRGCDDVTGVGSVTAKYITVAVAPRRP